MASIAIPRDVAWLFDSIAEDVDRGLRCRASIPDALIFARVRREERARAAETLLLDG
jgi:hypothetical protein